MALQQIQTVGILNAHKLTIDGSFGNPRQRVSVAEARAVNGKVSGRLLVTPGEMAAALTKNSAHFCGYPVWETIDVADFSCHEGAG